MDVLILFDYPHYHGGVNRILNLARGLKGNCKVYLLGVAFDNTLSFWKYRVEEEEVEGVRVMRFYANRLLPFFVFQFIFLRKFLKAKPVDIVQPYNPTYLTCLTPIIFKVLGKLKLVLMYDDIVTLRDRYGFFHFKFLQLIEKIVCGAADKVVVLTSFQKEYLMEKGVPGKKITIIPNFVDAASITSSVRSGEGIKQQLGIKGKVVLGYVGSVNRRSGLTDMIKVMPRLQAQGIHLLVVGDGDAIDGLKVLADEEGMSDRVTFKGRVSHRQIGNYYSSMDVLICPLKESPATLAVDPLKLYEFLATGRPVIATKVGSTADVIIDGVNGFLYPSGNIDEMFQKILFLIEHPKKAKELGAEGRKTVMEKHDINKVLRLWRGVYDESGGDKRA